MGVNVRYNPDIHFQQEIEIVSGDTMSISISIYSKGSIGIKAAVSCIANSSMQCRAYKNVINVPHTNMSLSEL